MAAMITKDGLVGEHQRSPALTIPQLQLPISPSVNESLLLQHPLDLRATNDPHLHLILDTQINS